MRSSCEPGLLVVLLAGCALSHRVDERVPLDGGMSSLEASVPRDATPDLMEPARDGGSCVVDLPPERVEGVCSELGWTVPAMQELPFQVVIRGQYLGCRVARVGRRLELIPQGHWSSGGGSDCAVIPPRTCDVLEAPECLVPPLPAGAYVVSVEGREMPLEVTSDPPPVGARTCIGGEGRPASHHRREAPDDPSVCAFDAICGGSLVRAFTRCATSRCEAVEVSPDLVEVVITTPTDCRDEAGLIPHLCWMGRGGPEARLMGSSETTDRTATSPPLGCLALP